MALRLRRLPSDGPQRTRRGGGVRWWVILLFGGYLIYYWFSHQQETSFTGRTQLVDTTVEQEAALGLQAYRQILSQSRVTNDPAVTGEVRDIATRLIAAVPRVEEQMAQASGTEVDSPLAAFEWEVAVIDSPDVNAFALPGGKIAVHTGIIPIARNQDGLAAIMGHEIAHALLRHGGERMAHQKLAQIGALAAGVAISDMEPQQQRAIMAALGAGAAYGILLPYSRDHESEADYVGLMIAAAACYDPREAPRLWERMAEAASAQPPEFMSTHPSHGSRIQGLEGWMPQALEMREASCGTQAP
ncbi:MAG TPA: M48 family metallopeptidase [Xanthomonadaceae bacterium]|nr:M48 family metallopeptidase [Xanthomonadaceae bacterium]